MKKLLIAAVCGIALFGAGKYSGIASVFEVGRSSSYQSSGEILEVFGNAVQEKLKKSFGSVTDLADAVKQKGSLEAEVLTPMFKGSDPEVDFKISIQGESRTDVSESNDEMDFELGVQLDIPDVVDTGEVKLDMLLKGLIDKDTILFKFPKLAFNMPHLGIDGSFAKAIQSTWYDIPWEILEPSMEEVQLQDLLKFQEIVPHLDFWETAGKFSMKGDWYEIDVVLDREKLKSSMFQIYDLLKSFPNSQDFIAELPQDKDFEHMPHVSGKFRINKKSIDQFSFQGVIDDQGYKQNFEMGWTEDRFWFLIPDEESESYLVEVDIEEGKGRVFIEELCEFWWKEEDSILTGQIFFSELDGLMTPLVEFRMEPREDRKGRKGVLEIKDMGAKFLIEQFDLSWYEQRFDLEGVVNFQGAPMLSLKTHYQSKAIAAFDLVKPTSTKSFQDFMREVQKNPLLQDILGESPGLVVPEDASNLPMRRNRYTSKVPKRFGVKKPAEALLEEPGVLSRSTVTQKTVEINGQSVNLEIRHHDYSGGESKIEILNPEALLEVFPDLAEPSTGLLEPGE